MCFVNGSQRTGSALGFFALRVRFGFGFGLANANADDEQQRAMKNGKAQKNKRRSFRGLLTGERLQVAKMAFFH